MRRGKYRRCYRSGIPGAYLPGYRLRAGGLPPVGGYRNTEAEGYLIYIRDNNPAFNRSEVTNLLNFQDKKNSSSSLNNAKSTHLFNEYAKPLLILFSA